MIDFYKPVRLDKWVANHDENWASATVISDDGSLIVSMFESDSECGYYWTSAWIEEDSLDPDFGGLWGPDDDDMDAIDRFCENNLSDEFVHTLTSCLSNSIDSMSEHVQEDRTNYNDSFYVISEDAFSIDEDKDIFEFFDGTKEEAMTRIHEIMDSINNDKEVENA